MCVSVCEVVVVVVVCVYVLCEWGLGGWRCCVSTRGKWAEGGNDPQVRIGPQRPSAGSDSHRATQIHIIHVGSCANGANWISLGLCWTPRPN